MPELIVRKWDGPYSFMIFREYGVYKARRGDTGEVQFEDPSKSVVIQNAINSLLQGGTIFLREVQLPADVTFGSNILIVEDYQGERTFYSNNAVKSWWEKSASYIIWTDGTYIYAVNGHTGKVEFSGTDAATVIQSAINALTEGGKIIIREGEYTADISLKSGVALIGSSRAENFIDFPDAPKTGTIINGTVSVEGTSTAVTDRIMGVVIRDLFIKGSLKIKYATGVTLENVFVHANGGTYAIWVDSSYTIIFRGVRVAGATYGFYVHNEVSTDPTSNVWMDYCFTENNGYAIYSDANLGHRIVFSGWIESERAFYGYALDICNSKLLMGNYNYNCIECTVLHATNLVMIGNYGGTAIKINDWGVAHLASCSITKFENAFYAGSNADIHAKGIDVAYCTYLFHLSSSANARAFMTGRIAAIDSGIGVVPGTWRFEGYTNANILSKNRGTATISSGNSSVTVNHGLVKAPAIVKLTGTDSEVKDCWVTNVTDTQFTINAPAAVSANRNVYWEAEV